MYKGRYNIASPWLQLFCTAVCVLAVVLIFISTSYVKGKCFQYYIRLHTQLLGRGPERFQGNRMSLPPELRSPNTISQVVEDSVKHCHATKFCCCKFEVSGDTCDNVFQLATQHVAPVEEKCCLYYFTFSTNHATSDLLQILHSH